MPPCVHPPSFSRGLKKLAPSAQPLRPAGDGDPRGLLGSGFHELLAAAPGDEAITLAFALSLAAGAAAQTGKGICFYGTASEAQEHGQLHGHGLAPLGTAPERIVMVTARNEKDLLWTLEEAAVSGAFGAIIGALPVKERLYGFAASRRLKLRAGAHNTPLFLLRSGQGQGATAAHGRWRVGSLPSEAEETVQSDGTLVGAPRLRLALERMGGLPPQHWEMSLYYSPDEVRGLEASLREEGINVARDFHLAPLLADGPARKTGGRHRAA